LIARALALLGSRRAWVVHGADGLDELSTTGYSKVSECRDGAVKTFYVHPSDVGLPKAPQTALAGGDAAANADIIRGVIEGLPGPARDVVLLNAGAALFVAGRVPRLADGLAAAADAIDTGAARQTLDLLVRWSARPPAADKGREP
jgi:anthranilate phosphoribosyltransferase